MLVLSALRIAFFLAALAVIFSNRRTSSVMRTWTSGPEPEREPVNAAVSGVASTPLWKQHKKRCRACGPRHNSWLSPVYSKVLINIEFKIPRQQKLRCKKASLMMTVTGTVITGPKAGRRVEPPSTAAEPDQFAAQVLAWGVGRNRKKRASGLSFSVSAT